MPCPGGVDIPRVFAAWNEGSLYDIPVGHSWSVSELKRLEMTPEKCLKCGACEKVCPQHLSIIEKLQEAWSELN